MGRLSQETLGGITSKEEQQSAAGESRVGSPGVGVAQTQGKETRKTELITGFLASEYGPVINRK